MIIFQELKAVHVAVFILQRLLVAGHIVFACQFRLALPKSKNIRVSIIA